MLYAHLTCFLILALTNLYAKKMTKTICISFPCRKPVGYYKHHNGQSYFLLKERKFKGKLILKDYFFFKQRKFSSQIMNST